MSARATRGSWLSGLIALGLLAVALAVANLPPPTAVPSLGSASQHAVGAYEKLPLSFVPNAGQTDPSVRYYAQASGRAFYFTPDRAVFSFSERNRSVALDLRFMGRSPKARLQALHRGSGEVSYMPGSDPQRWHTGLPTYKEIVYRELWPGIDMVFRGEGGKLEYEFLVRPGANPDDIRLAYGRASEVRLSRTGRLLVETPLGTLADSSPRSYQPIGERRVAVDSAFSLAGKGGHGNDYGFRMGRYDHRYALVIDPGLSYSTLLGGSDSESGQSIALDSEGNAYVTGTTGSPDFPTTQSAPDKVLDAGDFDAFVTKLNAAGSELIYSTFLVGSFGDEGHDIAVDAQGSAYITGNASDPGYPTTPGAYDRSFNGGADVFVTKLAPTGSSLVYSTFIGAASADTADGIAVDDQGNAYVAGVTLNSDYPVTPGAYDTSLNGNRDAFVTKLNSTGSALSYSTFIGGASDDWGEAIDIDAAGSAYVSGYTASTDLPTTPGAYDSTHNGGFYDAFASRLSPSGSGLDYSTYLGGSQIDENTSIAIDGQGDAYIAGYTTSTDFPTTLGAYDTSFNGNDSGDAFVTKLDQTGSSLAYSTYVGGTGFDNPADVAVDRLNSAYVTTLSSSPDFPTTSDAYDASLGGGFDATVTKLNAAGSALDYSTYLGGSDASIVANAQDEPGGIAVDDYENVYITGLTYTPDFPTTPGAYDTMLDGFGDGFVTRLNLGPSYPTPQSAPSLQASLVPIFKPCGTSGNPVNAGHAPPLGVGSCSPPQPGGIARIGSRSTMSGNLTVVPGDHIASNGDQADVTLHVALSDITTSAGSDYTPNLIGPDMTFYTRMRFTDLDNGPSGADPGTAEDFDFALPIDCTATPSQTVGSNCSANTSADAVTPGLVKEGQSTVLQTFRLRVNDSGLDGIRGNADDAIFANQGVFVP
jgi:hypothetical protein